MNLLLKGLIIAGSCATFNATALPAQEPVSHQVTALRNDTGIIIREDWMLEEKYMPSGTYHRTDGPAFIRRADDTGIVILEHWMQHGKFHREDGAAIIVRDSRTGAVTSEEWWSNGVKINPPQPQLKP